ncbi:hypothetical protein THAOC_04431, partial [Thalassiosira oceanica]
TTEIPETEATDATGVLLSNNFDGNNGEAAPTLTTEAPTTDVPATEATVAMVVLLSAFAGCIYYKGTVAVSVETLDDPHMQRRPLPQLT